MHRLKVAAALWEGEPVVQGEGARYLRDVLRLRPGAPVELFDGAGRLCGATVDRYLDDGVLLALGPVVERPATGVRFTLAQGLPKGDKLELVIQKAVELGATAVAPLACERSVVKLDDRKAADRVARWQKIADEAARQCGRADTLTVLPVQPLDAFVSRPREAGEERLILDEEERTTRLRTRLVDPMAHHICLVGPEGGLSREEVATAVRHGYTPVSLGPRILRTETVGLAVLAVAQHLLGDFG